MSLTYDSFFNQNVGSFGLWHIFVTIGITLTASPPLIQFNQLALLTPKHYCAQPTLLASGWTFDEILNLTVPRSPETGEFDSCLQYDLQFSVDNYSITREDVIVNTSTVPCQHGWMYDDRYSAFRYSVPREFNLVCERKMLTPMVASAFLFGMLPGPAVAGFLADRFGRRIVCFWSCLLGGFCVIGAAFLSNSAETLMLFRFISGFLMSSSSMTGFVLCAEITTFRKQNLFNFIFHFLAGTFGDAYNIFMSFVTQNWRLTCALDGSANFLVILFLFYAPESPRWLLVQNKHKEALRILKTAAKVNASCGRKSKWSDQYRNDEVSLKAMKELAKNEQQSEAQDQDTTSWKALFTTRVYFIRFCSLLFLWTASVCVLYSSLYFSMRLEGNPFSLAAIFASCTVLIVVANTVILQYVSSKRAVLTTCASLFVATSGNVFALYFLPSHPFTIFMSTMCYVFSFLLHIMLFTISPPLFPTGIRNSAIGLISGLFRIGCILAPFIERLDTVTGWKWFPMVITASLMLICTCISATLSFPDVSESEVTIDILDELEFHNLNISKGGDKEGDNLPAINEYKDINSVAEEAKV